MSDQHDPSETEVLYDCKDVLGKRRDRELPSVLSRLAVPREVETNNAVARRQMIGLAAPNMAVATPAVHENQRRFSLPAQVVADRNTVFRDDCIASLQDRISAAGNLPIRAFAAGEVRECGSAGPQGQVRTGAGHRALSIREQLARLADAELPDLAEVDVGHARNL